MKHLLLLLLLACTSCASAGNPDDVLARILQLGEWSEAAQGRDMSADQAKAILAELDKMGPADEAKLKVWLPANFRRSGIAGDRVKKMVILPRSKELKEIAIILLTNPEDEAAARATTVKSSKSNSND